MTNEQLLAKAAEAQSEFWEAIRELELALGVGISNDTDFANTSIEHLMETGYKP